MSNSSFFYGNEPLEMRKQLENGGGGGGGVTPEQFNELKALVDVLKNNFTEMKSYCLDLGRKSSLGYSVAKNLGIIEGDLNKTDYESNFVHIDDCMDDTFSFELPVPFNGSFSLECGGMVPFSLYADIAGVHEAIDCHGNLGGLFTVKFTDGSLVFTQEGESPQVIPYRGSDTKVIINGTGMSPYVVVNGVSFVKKPPYNYDKEVVKTYDDSIYVAPYQQTIFSLFSSHLHTYSDISFDSDVTYIDLVVDGEEVRVMIPKGKRNLRITVEDKIELGASVHYFVIKNTNTLAPMEYLRFRCLTNIDLVNARMKFVFNEPTNIYYEYCGIV